MYVVNAIHTKKYRLKKKIMKHYFLFYNFTVKYKIILIINIKLLNFVIVIFMTIIIVIIIVMIIITAKTLIYS